MIAAPPPFIIYALPRSRTFWLSKLLSHGTWKCGHDEMRHVRGLDDVQSLLAMQGFGSAETGAAPFWRLVQQMQPDIKTAVIRRPVDDVVESLMRTGVAYDRACLEIGMRKLDAKLDQIEARVPGVLSLRFDELDESGCIALSQHCIGQALPDGLYGAISGLNLQCDLEAMTRYSLAHLPQLERVGRQAKQRMLNELTRRPVASGGMTYQQEPFDIWLQDARGLFGQHLVEVGEHPDAWTEKNLDLMRTLEKLGALYVTTARSNGRLFGYLMSIVSPALDSQAMDGIQTTFFVSPDAPGIGLKLQRASVKFLRARGVTQVAFRAGTRGSAERLGALYRRMGAEDAGRMFTLNLKEVA